MERQIRVPLAAVALVLVAVLAAAALAVPATRDALGRAIDPRATAGPAELAAQRDGAERSVGRGYRKALEQLRTARGLRLPITEAEADRIFARSVDELGALRREALGALGGVYGLAGADLQSYVAEAEARLERVGGADEPDLLAPRLYSIVLRFGLLAQQIADKGTEELTRSPTPSPTSR